MIIHITAEVECDDCFCTQEFILTGYSKGLDEVRGKAERAGWLCDGEMICPDCRAQREDE